MTERKPKGMTWESWAERQVRVAAEQGVFDDLPGMGQPLPPSTTEEWDPDWWVKQKMAREQISYVPPGLQLRKDVEDALEGLVRLPSEQVARAVLEELNRRIVDSNRMAHSGPPANLVPLDVERFVQIWASAQPATAPPAPSAPAAGRGRWRRASRPSR